MAYKTEIQIGVKGTAQLDKLRQQVTSLNKKVNEIDESFGRGVQSVKRYEETLQKAADTLRKAKMATDDEQRAVKQYVTALNNANAAQQRQNSLIETEITRRGQATQALRKYNAELAAPRQPGGSMAGSYLRPQQARGTTQFSGPIGPGQASQTALSQLLPPSSRFFGGTQYQFPIGPQPDAAAAFMKRTEAAAAAAKRLTAEFIVNQRAARQLAEEQRRINSAEFIERTDAAAKAANRQNAEFLKQIRLQKQAQNLIDRGKVDPSQYLEPIGPQPAGAKGGKGFLGRVADFGLGAGFPLLFGGGAGQVLGGTLGTVLGGGGPAGFGLQIAFSAIGGQIEDAIARTAELGRALESLDLSALADSTLLVNAELREAVQNFIDLGENQRAVELLARETLAQTGLLPESVNDTTEAALRLSNAWDESVGAVNGLVALVSTDLVNALAVTLRFVNAILKVINTLVGKVRELSDNEFVKLALRILPIIGPLQQAKQFLDDILKLTKGVDEATEERTATLLQTGKELEKELGLEQQLFAIESRRTAGTDAAAKLNSAQIKRDSDLLKLKAETQQKIVDKNREFAGVQGEVLENERKAQIAKIEQLAAIEQARIENKFALDEQAAGQQRIKEIEKERKELAKETQEIRARESQIGQARIQTQLSELANEERIFQLRQQTAVASIQLDRARLDAQLSLLQLQESRLQRELDGLQRLNTNFERQRELVDAIARNRANQVKIENQVAKVQAQQGVRQAQIALQQIKFQVQRINLEIQLQRIKAQGEKDDNVRLAQLREINAIARQSQELTSVMLSEGRKQVNIAAQIAGEQKKVADNILRGKLESIEAERVEARRAINAKELAKATGQAADEAARLNSSMSSGGGGASGRTVSTSLPIDPDVEATVKASKPFGFRNIFELTEALDEAQRIKNAQTARTAQMSRPSSNSFASARSYSPGGSFGASSRGTTSVNISTGPVLEFDGKRYMTMDDFERGVAELAGAQAQRARSYGSRRYGGIS